MLISFHYVVLIFEIMKYKKNVYSLPNLFGIANFLRIQFKNNKYLMIKMGCFKRNLIQFC